LEERRSFMADTVRGVEYHYVTVPDAPGEGQRILSALKESGVNLVAYLGFPLGGGQSQIDLVPDDPQVLRDAAERAGVTLSEAKRAFLIQGDDRVGAVADTTSRGALRNDPMGGACGLRQGGRRPRCVAPAETAARSQMALLLYLDQNYLSA
jgi:hypothetical protein